MRYFSDPFAPLDLVASPQVNGGDQCRCLRCWVPTQRPGQTKGTAQWLLTRYKSQLGSVRKGCCSFMGLEGLLSCLIKDKANGSFFPGVHGSSPVIPVGSGHSSEGKCQCWGPCAVPSVLRITAEVSEPQRVYFPSQSSAPSSLTPSFYSRDCCGTWGAPKTFRLGQAAQDLHPEPARALWGHPGRVGMLLQLSQGSGGSSCPARKVRDDPPALPGCV